MQKSIDDYFIAIDTYNENRSEKERFKPYTVTGMALHLGFCSRQSLIDYEGKDEYFDTIKKAKARIEQFNEEMLYKDGQVTGIIFNLKNNFDWKDKTEVDATNTNLNKSIKDKAELKEFHDAIDELI
jgi:hypothetical protein